MLYIMTSLIITSLTTCRITIRTTIIRVTTSMNHRTTLATPIAASTGNMPRKNHHNICPILSNTHASDPARKIINHRLDAVIMEMSYAFVKITGCLPRMNRIGFSMLSRKLTS